MSEEKKSLSFFQVIGSVLASFLGVQKNENRARDFTHGRARDFIIAGVVVTLAFVLLVWGVVKLVTRLAMP